MIRLGLRLTLNGGKEVAVRLIVTAVSVAIGVGLLLTALAGMHAIHAQNARTAWLNTTEFAGGGHQQVGPGVSGPAVTTADQLWWMSTTEHYANLTIDRVDVAGTGPHSPIPPGIPRLPGPGQFYASPALTRLLGTTPADELGDRYPGRQIGTIGASALPSPNSLIVVVGHAPTQLSSLATEISGFNTDPAFSGANGWDANKLQIILAVGALALLFPVLIFIGTATRLSAARREQRFAAMRLVGATPRQVAVISAVEATVAAVAGVAVGFGLFYVLRPWITDFDFTGARFAPGDLTLSATDVASVALGVPIAAALAARVALRRVQLSPLGVTRRVTPPAPRAYRVLPLVAGIAELSYFVWVGRPKTTGGQIDAYFTGCFLIMAGLITAGPWLTMAGSRLLARRTSRPAVLIAGRRLADNPRAAFRAISGLIIALFATSVSVGVITTMVSYQGVSSSSATRETLVAQAFPAPPDALGPAPSLPAGLLGSLHTTPGVDGVTTLYGGADQGGGPAPPPAVLAPCDQLAATPAIGRCAPGATVAAITDSLDTNGLNPQSKLAGKVWPTAAKTTAELESMPIRAIVVQTDGSRAAVERVRTLLEVALPSWAAPTTLSEVDANTVRPVIELRQMTNVVIAVSLVIAGCSLAVSVTAGVNDRKRPFSLLRLTGVPFQALRRVVALEAAVPLLLISVLSAGMGFLAAGLFLRSQLSESLQPPGAGYYTIVLAGLAGALAVIASTVPLIDRITGPEVARNE